MESLIYSRFSVPRYELFVLSVLKNSHFYHFAALQLQLLLLYIACSSCGSENESESDSGGH